MCFAERAYWKREPNFGGKVSLVASVTRSGFAVRAPNLIPSVNAARAFVIVDCGQLARLYTTRGVVRFAALPYQASAPRRSRRGRVSRQEPG